MQQTENNFERAILISKYKEKQLESMKKLYPNQSEEKIKQFLDMRAKDNYKEVKCRLVNNYRNTEEEFTLLEIIDFIEENKPITTEHGVLFKNHNEALNNNAKMLESIIGSRKIEKNLMFKAI